ncbi:dihydroneopterin aldolase [Spirochaetota bacterium]|nr:dihydroneopterin aldolase [Spirochaetota bacterium]
MPYTVPYITTPLMTTPLIPSCDEIFLKDIELYIVIGVHSHERVRHQKVRLSITLYIDTRKPAESDNLRDTVNYETLKEAIEDMSKSKNFHLIEAFGQAAANLCFKLTTSTAVKITVAKEWVLAHTHSVGVVLYRNRSELT